MTKAILIILLLIKLVIPVSAFDLDAPKVPSSGQELMPENTESFLDGFRELVENALSFMHPEMKAASAASVTVIAAVLILSAVQCVGNHVCQSINLISVAVISGILLNNSKAMIPLAAETICQLESYGKLLLPIMTAALAAQGGTSSSAALYTGTMVFDTLLCSLICEVFLPAVYLFLALSIAFSATGEELLKRIRDLIRNAIVWSLKLLLSIFTTYMSITGVVSGATDAATLKAAKLTIASVVPVVGGIMSDASEAILVSAQLVRNAAGIYGILAVLAVFLSPFIRIGCQYLMLKLLSFVCCPISSPRLLSVIDDTATAMGLLLAMTGSVCLMLLISTVCFIKGTG